MILRKSLAIKWRLILIIISIKIELYCFKGLLVIINIRLGPNTVSSYIVLSMASLLQSLSLCLDKMDNYESLNASSLSLLYCSSATSSSNQATQNESWLKIIPQCSFWDPESLMERCHVLLLVALLCDGRHRSQRFGLRIKWRQTCRIIWHNAWYVVGAQ